MTIDTDDSRLVPILLVVVGALVVVPMFMMGFGMMGFGPMMGGTWGGGMYGGGMYGSGMWGDGTAPVWVFAVSALLRLLVLAALVGAGYLVYRAVTADDGSDRALEELRLAYARGDLTDEEYETRREVLERDV